MIHDIRRPFVLAFGCLVVATACTSLTYAADYRYEVDASYGDRSGSFTTVRSRSLSGRYYLSRVDDSHGPLALASFIERASSVTLFVADSESSFDFPSAPFTSVMLSPGAAAALLNDAYDFFPAVGFPISAVAFAGPVSENERYGAAFEYVSDSAWIARGELTANDATSSQFSFDRAEDGASLELGVGRYVSDLLSITLSYRYADLDTESTFLSFSCSPTAACSTSRIPYSGGKIKDRAWSLASRYLLPQGSVFHEFTATASYGTRSEDVGPLPQGASLPIDVFPAQFDFYRWQLAAGYTLYPRPDWGIGVHLSHLDSEGEELQTYALRGTWFVKSAIAVRASFSRSATNSDTFAIGVEDIDGFELSLIGRF